MKNKVLIICLFVGFLSQAQEKAKDVLSAKVGLIGAWVSYEKAISTNATLIGELGYRGGFSYSYSKYFGSNFAYVLGPMIGIESRYYYNFDRRIEKDKSTTNNAANFLGLELLYAPDFGIITNSDNYDYYQSLSLFTKYGLRRNLGKKINFEFSFGPGYQWVEKHDGGVTFGLDAKFGFVF